MIIDVHCHIWEKDIIQEDMAAVLDGVAVELGLKNPGAIYDGSLDRLLREMDEAGIDKTVILPLDYEYNYSGGDFSAKRFNDLAGRYVREAPDRIVAFAGVDPRRGQAGCDELRRCVEELGFRGLKLWTVTGFRPDDEECYPLYETAADLGVDVMVHTGLGPGESYLATCRPVYVDQPAVDFREINFIMAHVGTPWTDEALAVARKNRNVFVDISAWQGAHALLPLSLAQVLSQAKLLHGGMHKVLFGSDWPLFTEICPQKDWVGVIRGLEHPPPLQIMGLPEITGEDKRMILGNNAARVLRL